MRIKFTSKYLLTLLLLIFVRNVNAQCVDIQTILVDACSATSPSNDEGFNEMVRFRVGPNPLNVSNLSVNWPSNAWTGVVQNATTATKVASINASIIAAGNCGQVLEPTGGVLPANSTVLLVTSQNFTINYNSFNSLTSTLYIIFQNNNSVTGGHFGNYNPTPGTRSLSISFGGTCSDTVTYERSNLVNIFGVSGGTLAEQDGAAVNFSPSGVPTYVNEGCTAPVPPFTVNATASPTSCVSPGSVVNLTGSAQGYQSLQWTSDSGGTFSTPIALNSNFTVPSTATGTITLTLTATNVCNVSISSSVSINIGSSITPTVTPLTYCQNATASPLTAAASTGGTLNWYGTNSTGGTASSTAPTPSTTNVGTTTYYVSQTIGGCESPRVAIVVTVSNTPPTQAPQLFCNPTNSTPTSVNFDFNNIGQTNFTYSYSIDGGTPVTGTHVSPSNFSVPGVAPGQTVTFSLTWNGVCGASLTASTTVPTFSQLGPYCAGQTIPNLPLTSLNNKTGTWSPAVVDNMNTGTYVFTPNPEQCASRTSMTIVVTSTPTLVITNPPAVCSPSTVDLTLASVTAGSSAGTLSYWTNAAGTTVLNNPNAVTSSGTYYIRLTNGSCSTIQPVVVTIVPQVVIAINIVENCGGNVITVTNPIGSNFAYSLDGAIPQSSPVFNNLTAGNHSIVAIETVGNCTSAPFNFFVNPFVNDVIVNPNPLPLQLCDPNNDGFSVF
ncbi:hypothetical protein, partial [Flavobacterium macrobrachii]|uniref:Ig-like domain-containing protein n=1 Tax=Flavobacterium macrobrachii TaxID=591204 RepID=UPI003F71BA1B